MRRQFKNEVSAIRKILVNNFPASVARPICWSNHNEMNAVPVEQDQISPLSTSSVSIYTMRHQQHWDACIFLPTHIWEMLLVAHPGFIKVLRTQDATTSYLQERQLQMKEDHALTSNHVELIRMSSQVTIERGWWIISCLRTHACLNMARFTVDSR